MSKYWKTGFPFCNMRKIPRFSSDHNPLIYSNEQETKKTTKPFENYWLKHHDFMPKIAAIWEKEVKAKNSVERWCININRIKKILKGWGQNNFFIELDLQRIFCGIGLLLEGNLAGC